MAILNVVGLGVNFGWGGRGGSINIDRILFAFRPFSPGGGLYNQSILTESLPVLPYFLQSFVNF